jgi:flavin reductase (DIM6/NTAB) family NADH-FMN oxidoreductase RutF
MATEKLSPLDFRLALGQFATGVTVVTVERAPGVVHGMTANSFTSVSLDPLLILVCVEERARLLPLLQAKRRFGVSILKDNQRAISEFFARSDQPEDAEQRLGISYRWMRNAVPVIEHTLCQIACTLVQTHVAGDHTICLGEVESAEIFAGEPLIFFRGEYRRIARHGGSHEG